MKDRIPTYPGRVKLVPVEGAPNTFDMTRADVPTEEGTPLNKSTLLADSTAALVGLGTSATPNDALAALATKTNNLSDTIEAGGGMPDVVPIDRGGTGGTTVAEARANLGITDGGGGGNTPSINFPITIAQGGTGSTTAKQAINSLGITWGTTDLVAGKSTLADGKIYFVYRP